MANNPSVTTTVSDTAGAVASGLDLVCVLSPCATNADITPRRFGSAKAIYAQHGYCEGVEYAALHAKRTGKALMFVGLPIDTAGAISREDTSGNSGSSVSSLAAGGDGVLAEHDGEIVVVAGGTVGTDQIVLGYSLDGGRTSKNVRLGTATSYVIPFFNVTHSLTVGTLVAGETIHTWHGSAPRAASADITTAREALAAQQKGFRSILLIGDLQSDTEATAFLDELEAYETENKRFVYGRASVYDREPQAALSVTSHRMTGSPTITFAEVGGTGDTITRSAGSFVADGFAAGDLITVAGAVASAGANNITTAKKIVTVTALVITLDDDDLVDEGPISGVSIVGRPSLTFANAGDTITRSRGSWLTDGFREGDTVTISGTDGGTNDGSFVIDTLTATVMTLAAGGVDADEVSPTSQVSITTGQTKAAWMAEIDAEFAPADDAPRLRLGSGRGRVLSPFSGWYMRRPSNWAASLREYQHDLHIPTWRKDDGPVGFDLYDANDVLVEWDDRVDGGAGTAARFVTLWTWANGPEGAFIAQDLTRAQDGSLLSRSHNQAVVDLACTTVQLNTENLIGRVLVLNDDGTATSDARKTIESEINSALDLALLTDRGEGPRASKAVWSMSADDVLNVPEAVVTGVLELLLNGTIHSVNTTVRVISGGQ
jgi:hypothetical protein